MAESEEWDDAALIEHYDKSMLKIQEALDKKLSLKDNPTEPKKRNKSNKKEGKNGKKPKNKIWKVGEFCRCIFPDDGLYYEAEITEISNETHAWVAYIGYGDEACVSLASLKVGSGAEARAMQEERSQELYEHEEVEQEESVEKDIPVPTSKPKKNQKRPLSDNHIKNHQQPSSENHIKNHQPSSENHVRNHQQPSFPKHPSCCHGHGNPKNRCSSKNYSDDKYDSTPMAPPGLLPPPPFPRGTDPAMHAMLMSWYMTGYHAGYYEALQGAKCPRHPPPLNGF